MHLATVTSIGLSLHLPEELDLSNRRKDRLPMILEHSCVARSIRDAHVYKKFLFDVRFAQFFIVVDHVETLLLFSVEFVDVVQSTFAVVQICFQ